MSCRFVFSLSAFIYLSLIYYRYIYIPRHEIASILTGFRATHHHPVDIWDRVAHRQKLDWRLPVDQKWEDAKSEAEPNIRTWLFLFFHIVPQQITSRSSKGQTIGPCSVYFHAFVVNGVGHTPATTSIKPVLFVGYRVILHNFDQRTAKLHPNYPTKWVRQRSTRPMVNDSWRLQRLMDGTTGRSWRPHPVHYVYIYLAIGGSVKFSRSTYSRVFYNESPILSARKLLSDRKNIVPLWPKI